MLFRLTLICVSIIHFQVFSQEMPIFPKEPRCSKKDMAFWRVNSLGQTECDLKYTQYLVNLEVHCQKLKKINDTLPQEEQVDIPLQPTFFLKRIFQNEQILQEMFEYIEIVKECHQELSKRTTRM